MLNSIGLDNDGIEAFIDRHLPYLAALGTAIIVSIAGKSYEEFVEMAARLDGLPGVAALELNISCPNVSGGVDFGTDPRDVRASGGRLPQACSLPILAKLTPNVTDITADRPGGRGRRGRRAVADQYLPGHGHRLAHAAVRCWETCLGGLSGPAIKPIALRVVYQVARAVSIPLVGIGGIATIDDVMEFLVAGATAVQIGTANFYNPTRFHRRSSTPCPPPWPSWAPPRWRSRGHPAMRDSAADRRAKLRKCDILHESMIHRMRVLSGIQPTGRFHWGNYFGAIRQYIDLQGEPEDAFYFIANLHALTTVRDRAAAAANTRSTRPSTCWPWASIRTGRRSSCSPTCPRSRELCWLLMTGTPMGLLERCHAYKDKKAKGLTADAGLFTYPVLMAADILMYDSDVVPVGEDQVQHIEVCRDLAASFNHQFGETFVLPKAKCSTARPGCRALDGEKMSKSYGNTLEVFEDPKALRKKIMRIVTDSRPDGAAQGARQRSPLPALLACLPARPSGRRWRPPIAAAVSATAR